MVGNMISDFVKGKARYSYLPTIQSGIELHRRIDTFTDVHAATKSATAIFKPYYRLYGAVFMDIVYDHFLATDVTLFSKTSLYQFTQEVYAILDSYATHLPERFLYMLPYMKVDNWLYNYYDTYAIHKSFKGIVRRSSFLKEGDTAFNLFLDNYSFLQECYKNFFPDVIAFSQQQFKLLVT